MTQEREQLLNKTFRRMLRQIVGTPRRYLGNNNVEKEEETWVDWIIRATGVAKNEMKKTGLDNWVEAQRKRKWNLWRCLALTGDGHNRS